MWGVRGGGGGGRVLLCGAVLVVGVDSGRTSGKGRGSVTGVEAGVWGGGGRGAFAGADTGLDVRQDGLLLQGLHIGPRHVLPSEVLQAGLARQPLRKPVKTIARLGSPDGSRPGGEVLGTVVVEVVVVGPRGG